MASPGEAPSPAALVAFVEDEPLVFPPGSQYAYSNTDNITVGLMIEAVTGKGYADVLAEQVFGPLGLDETSLPAGTELPDPLFHGYAIDADSQLEDQSTLVAAGYPWASGGIVSTPADLNDFIRGYVGGELFGDEVRATQQDLFIPDGELRTLRAGRQLGQHGPVPVRHGLRHGVRPHRQLLRLHPVRRCVA